MSSNKVAAQEVALRMLEASKRCLSEARHDVAAFLTEQSVLLLSKSVVLKLTSGVSRTRTVG
ncbi:MAG: HEPN domain-containing protein [Thermofilaceae archaeon]